MLPLLVGTEATTVAGPTQTVSGDHVILMEGIVAGDSVQIQVQSPNGTWVALSDGLLTVDDAYTYRFWRSCAVRAVPTKAGASTVEVWIKTTKRRSGE